jgi:hypothetical protein
MTKVFSDLTKASLHIIVIRPHEDFQESKGFTPNCFFS